MTTEHHSRLIKANSFSFRRRYFLKFNNDNNEAPSDSRTPPKTPTTTSLKSMRANETGFDSSSRKTMSLSPPPPPQLNFVDNHSSTRHLRNSAPVSKAADRNNVNVQQLLSTSWEFIRPVIKCQNEKNVVGDICPNGIVGGGDDVHDLVSPRYLNVQRGKISFGPPPLPPQRILIPDKDGEKACQSKRIVELEDALHRLQERVNQSQYGSSTLEKELKQQIDDMSKAINSKEKRTMQVCQEHKTLQDKFQKQESSLQELQYENKLLQKRIQQYEKCLDDVTKKVIDAIINEDRLRVEVGMLKDRVHDLETQQQNHSNTNSTGSPAKGRDEGYCTMPPTNSTLENLPEEPEQYLIATCSTFNCCSSDGAAEPCTAEMEDWSLSQEDVGGTITLDEDWIWKEAKSINGCMHSNDAEHSSLLENPIVYSDDDDELVCKEFTSDYYRLVNIKSESNKSLVLENDRNEFNPESSDDGSDNKEECGSCDDADEANDEDSEEDDSARNRSVVEKKSKEVKSPTPSEGGRQQILSCSSSSESSQELIESTGIQRTSISLPNTPLKRSTINGSRLPPPPPPIRRCNLPISRSSNLNPNALTKASWRQSTGWRRISPQSTELITQVKSIKLGSVENSDKIPIGTARPNPSSRLPSNLQSFKS